MFHTFSVHRDMIASYSSFRLFILEGAPPTGELQSDVVSESLLLRSSRTTVNYAYISLIPHWTNLKYQAWKTRDQECDEKNDKSYITILNFGDTYRNVYVVLFNNTHYNDLNTKS